MKYAFSVLGIALATILLFMLWKFTRPTPVSGIEIFAQCLAEKNVKMYGAWWCTHCQNQKEIFGDAFKYIHYIECTDAKNLAEKKCERANVRVFPTWIFTDGSRNEGEMSIQSLSEKTTCSLPTQKK